MGVLVFPTSVLVFPTTLTLPIKKVAFEPDGKLCYSLLIHSITAYFSARFSLTSERIRLTVVSSLIQSSSAIHALLAYAYIRVASSFAT